MDKRKLENDAKLYAETEGKKHFEKFYNEGKSIDVLIAQVYVDAAERTERELSVKPAVDKKLRAAATISFVVASALFVFLVVLSFMNNSKLNEILRGESPSSLASAEKNLSETNLPTDCDSSGEGVPFRKEVYMAWPEEVPIFLPCGPVAIKARGGRGMVDITELCTRSVRIGVRDLDFPGRGLGDTKNVDWPSSGWHVEVVPVDSGERPPVIASLSGFSPEKVVLYGARPGRAEVMVRHDDCPDSARIFVVVEDWDDFQSKAAN